MKTQVYLWLGTILLGHVAAGPLAAQADEQLAREGFNFLNKYCYECHGLQLAKPPLNVRDRDILLRDRGKRTYLTPGKPDASYLWRRVENGSMPPEDRPNRPSEEETKKFRAWIEAGAPFPSAEPTRTFKSQIDILTALRDHLRQVPSDDRKFQRYFTLTHLHNNRRNVNEVEFRLYRAALSKMMNSLSWQRNIVLPQAIDKEGTIFHVDLRQLGWHEEAGRPNMWRELLKVYPYGLKHDASTDPTLRELAREVYQLAEIDVPYLRADWFVVTASQPPLYHTLLQLPKTAQELEQKLDVNVAENFRNARLARAGVITSGVSRQNRLLERHPARYGAYWKSYDFKTSGGKGNLLRFPLGPNFKDHPFADLIFESDGGEILFHLPNGLQAYLLVDKDEKRIDRGPIHIVRDLHETAGTPEIVNGLSCMSCHKHGVVSGFKDVLREQSGVQGNALLRLQRLHPTVTEMNKLLQEDEQMFLQALEKAMASFLKVAEDQNKPLDKFEDPIGAVARRYFKDLDVDDVAAELGFNDASKFRAKVENERTLRELGLGPLAVGASIKRELWDFLDGMPLFQLVARECDLGRPVILK